MGRHKIDETGNTYNRLTVLSEAGRDVWGSVLWNCSCSCGRHITVPGTSLRSLGTQSCGCLRLEQSKRKYFKTRLSKGVKARNRLFRRYKVLALREKVPFTLYLGQFMELTKENCYLCGVEPKQVLKDHNTAPAMTKEEWENTTWVRQRYYDYEEYLDRVEWFLQEIGEYIYNDIIFDDPSRGYAVGNCAPICAVCKRAKGDLSNNEFHTWVQKFCDKS